MNGIEKAAKKLMAGILTPKKVMVIDTKQRSRRYVIKLVCKDGNHFIRLRKDQAGDIMSGFMEFEELTYCGEFNEKKKDLVGG